MPFIQRHFFSEIGFLLEGDHQSKSSKRFALSLANNLILLQALCFYFGF